jgi:hypothetical protein
MWWVFAAANTYHPKLSGGLAISQTPQFGCLNVLRSAFAVNRYFSPISRQVTSHYHSSLTVLLAKDLDHEYPTNQLGLPDKTSDDVRPTCLE